MTLTAGFKQRALMPAPQLLALTAGESTAEQLLPKQDVEASALPPLPRTPAEKLAASQAEAKKVILNPSSTQAERSAAQAEVMQAQRELKISRKAANRKRRITVANQLKKN